MGFFDLNIPYDEHSSSSSIRVNRIKIVAKLMELGYSGIAYNRTIKGVMSDKDRCTIPLLNVSSLQSILPTFSASLEFHRNLLGVPRSSPFRQYTRLTICINSLQEILAVNSGNLILKTYDLIAVKPLNQNAFEQACEKLEIDIIAIDFAEKLPFRLKQGHIKSAIQRGVYFEIMYSDLLSDVHARRQMISATKVLVDWTKGKNLILSSAASSVNEIRGPFDVANFSSLLGVSMERAKAAVSKNCRNLIANALKRKQFYKETIRVERISSDDKLDLNDPWSVDLFKWDPISSGEGDLLLDDIAKSFAASNKSKIVKAIDFTSVIDNMPPQGFLVKNVTSGSEAKVSLNDNRGSSHVVDAIEPPIAVNGVIQQSCPLDGKHCSTSDRPCSGDAGNVRSNSDEDKCTVEEIVQPKASMQEKPIGMDIDNVQPQNPLPSSELNVASTNVFVHYPTSTRDVLDVVSINDGKETFTMSEDVASHRHEYCLKSSDTLSGLESVLRDKSSTNLVSENPKNMTTVVDGSFTAEECLVGARLGEPMDVAAVEDRVSPLSSCMIDIKDDYLISIRQQTSEVLMEEQKSGEADPQIKPPPLDQSISGVMSTGTCRAKRKRHQHHPALKLLRLTNPKVFKRVQETYSEKYRSKRRRHRPALLLPFKRLINPLFFKKVRKTKS
ncbi:Ribonuclease P protein subunit p30, partial [Cucurbita argyrosperma subsp. argyrosperma]